ncbi:MAG: hypothetical protein MZV63_58905 [Marinilabiliales bacterium]|nr:hypothetical protein [Marinilabiliales bacterium]
MEPGILFEATERAVDVEGHLGPGPVHADDVHPGPQGDRVPFAGAGQPLAADGAFERGLSERTDQEPVAFHLVGFRGQDRAPVPGIFAERDPGLDGDLVARHDPVRTGRPQTGREAVQPKSVAPDARGLLDISFQGVHRPADGLGRFRAVQSLERPVRLRVLRGGLDRANGQDDHSELLAHEVAPFGPMRTFYPQAGSSCRDRWAEMNIMADV